MKIRSTRYFQKQVFALRKRFLHVEADLRYELENFLPEKSIALGRGVFKLRAKNSDIPCGKSGGYRLILFFEHHKQIVVPLLIYAKRDRDNVASRDIERALTAVLAEL